MIDHQWPTPVLTHLRPFNENVPTKTRFLEQYDELEGILSRQFGMKALLFPSARAGIGAILEYEKVGRGDSVFAPLYSSHCLWDTIGRYACPTTTCSPEVKVAMVVHKYGYVHHYPLKSAVLIEDSVDSLIIDPSASMPLLGKYEVFSLPKIIGTWCGGIITTSDSGFLEWVKEWRQGNNPLASHQSKLKYLSCLGKLENFTHQNFLEATNRELDLNGLLNIADQINYIGEASEIIQSRLGKIFQKFESQYFENNGRLPCVLPLSQRYYNVKNPQQWMVRHFNVSKDYSCQEYESCWILPLHFGIDSALFNLLLNDLQQI